MRIGIDLDNTLVCYDEAFNKVARHLNIVPPSWTGGKNEVKETLTRRPDGHIAWQKLQGQVYGKWISLAALYPGAYRFLWRCKQRGIEVDIVSHKTEYGHYDKEKIPLRKSAIDLLSRLKILSEDSSCQVKTVEFFSTRKDKVDYIAGKKYDWFIDDLPEIFAMSNFPKETNKLLFKPGHRDESVEIDTVATWLEIGERLLGHWKDWEVIELASKMSEQEIVGVYKNVGQGNSQIFQITLANQKKAALKIYPDMDSHNRLRSEYEGLRLLRKFRIAEVAEVLGCHEDVNAGLYEWVEGDSITEVSLVDVYKLLSFIKDLHRIRSAPEWLSFPNASAAVFSGKQLEQQIQNRLKDLSKLASKSGPLHQYLETELKPVVTKIIEWMQALWPSAHSYDQKLLTKERALSPSDFGFHNAKISEGGSIKFLDFEYFGWDDPAKLVGDVLLHPAMNLNSQMRQAWLDGTTEIFGISMRNRLEVMWPGLALCWCLIMLNEHKNSGWIRRKAAANLQANSRPRVLDQQLAKSRRMLEMTSTQYQKFPF